MSLASMWETFREAGPVAWVIVPAGLLGAPGALVALVLAVVRPAAAFRLALSIVALGVLCAGLGAVGVAQGRAATEATIAHGDASPARADTLRRVGYRQARSAAGLGLALAAVPLLGGVTTLFVARRRRPSFADLSDEREPTPVPRSDLGLPFGAAVLGLVSGGFALAALSAPVPSRGPSIIDGDAVAFEEVVDAIGRLQADQGDSFLATCAQLERMLAREPRKPPPDLPVAAKRCVEARIAHAVVQSPLHVVKDELEGVLRSGFVRRYPRLTALVRADLDEVERMEEAARERPWELDPRTPFVTAQIQRGNVTVNGALPLTAVQRTVQERHARFRRCYEIALSTYPNLAGRISMRFVIGRDGQVTSTSITSDLGDANLVACVESAASGLSFPEPDGGTVTVVYPIQLSPPEG
ncbi:Hypothetical protein A7982_11548 [Minicystis rosea]|nr:Hypothetical protein A7982_11548 [Minicystis rosea]